MKKIILINCYFGKFPSNFDITLQSMAFNESIDFLIFTDNNIDDNYKLYKNISFVTLTLFELKKIIEEHLHMIVALNTPYKVCDYKPIYGYIFSQYIMGYDYWGCFDLDVIFGDLRFFITEDILKKFDKIYFLGHLTIYKNTDEINRVFMKNIGLDYKNVFTSNINYIFDEENGIQKKFDCLNIPTYKNIDFIDISKKHYQFRRGTLFISSKEKKGVNYPIQTFLYNNGKIFHLYKKNNELLSKEYAYIHFSSRNLYKNERNNKFNPNFYLITYNGMITADKEIDITYIKNVNKFRLVKEIKHKFVFYYKKISQKLHKITFKFQKNTRSDKLKL